jgi:predicted nucleic acid-binding protein
MICLDTNYLICGVAEGTSEAAELVARKRSLRVDAMIAGTAITAKASLATNNRTDFEPFASHGLQLL